MRLLAVSDHVEFRDGHSGAGDHRHGDTVVRNVVGRHVFEVEPQRSHQRRAS
jgi:hypothetical protein